MTSNATNTPELSVSELSNALRQTVEDAYSYVRLRGEISGFKRAASGHLYMSLKDTDSVIDAVCWRGQTGRLQMVPEDGLEVIATGRLTTYPGRSKYQIVIEGLELAGEGALLKILETRRRDMTKEGLFDPARKKKLPYLPEVIGIVTSPTGAVIRDIKHRLDDRFPRHILLWPTLVQGNGAAENIARGIEIFNQLPPDGAIPRPDLLIVARGGGSLEDLWCFNEEIVVRAAANSAIPLISAIGHETDEPLIDFASDKRAPTPTAAAEMAVPVRRDLQLQIADLARRAFGHLHRTFDMHDAMLINLSRRLPPSDKILHSASRHLGGVMNNLNKSMSLGLERRAQKLAMAAGRLVHPHQHLERQAHQLSGLAGRLDRAMQAGKNRAAAQYEAARLSARLAVSRDKILEDRRSKLRQISRNLENLSYHKILERGFSVVRNEAGSVIKSIKEAEIGQPVSITFGDRKSLDAVLGLDSFARAYKGMRTPRPKKTEKKNKAKKTRKPSHKDDRQDELF